METRVQALPLIQRVSAILELLGTGGGGGGTEEKRVG